jgi:hypothetical protein
MLSSGVICGGNRGWKPEKLRFFQQGSGLVSLSPDEDEGASLRLENGFIATWVGQLSRDWVFLAYLMPCA